MIWRISTIKCFWTWNMTDQSSKSVENEALQKGKWWQIVCHTFFFSKPEPLGSWFVKDISSYCWMMLDDVGCQAHHGEAPSRSHHVPQAMRHCHWCDGPVPTSIMGEYHRTPMAWCEWGCWRSILGVRTEVYTWYTRVWSTATAILWKIIWNFGMVGK